jgi:hypothetical protein
LTQVDFDKLADDTKRWLSVYVPVAPDLPPECKTNIIISIVSRHITQLARPWNYFGLPPTLESSYVCVIELARKFCNRSPDLAGRTETIHAEDSFSQETKEWLVLTGKLLQADDASSFEEAQAKLVEKMTVNVSNILRPAIQPPSVWPKKVDKRLRKIFKTAFEFFRILHQQRASFEVRLIEASKDKRDTCFNALSMDDIVPGEEDVEGEHVEISVFPGLYKIANDDDTTVSTSPSIFCSETNRPSRFAKDTF